MRGLRRPERGARDRRKRSQHVENPGGSSGEHHCRRGSHQHGAQKIGRDHHPHALESIAENGGERRSDSGRQHHHECENAERCSPARLEDEHRECKQVTPTADLRADESELEAPQPGVAEAAGEGADGFREPGGERSHERTSRGGS